MRFLVSICISHTGISRCPIGQDKKLLVLQGCETGFGERQYT